MTNNDLIVIGDDELPLLSAPAAGAVTIAIPRDCDARVAYLLGLAMRKAAGEVTARSGNKQLKNASKIRNTTPPSSA